MGKQLLLGTREIAFALGCSLEMIRERARLEKWIFKRVMGPGKNGRLLFKLDDLPTDVAEQILRRRAKMRVKPSKLFAIRIRQLRKDEGLTQAEVGELLGYTAGHVSKLESSAEKVTDDCIAKYAAVFDVSESSLRGEEQKPTAIIPAPPVKKNRAPRAMPFNLTLLFAVWIVALLLLAALLFAPQAHAADPWDRTDLALAGAALTLKAVDFGQTRYVAQHPERFHECNPVLGKHPSESDVALFFAAGALTEIVVAHFLPAPWRKAWLGCCISGSLICTTHNASIGLKVAW
jgi:transcriptional regulator with XRE-family HTH domain